MEGVSDPILPDIIPSLLAVVKSNSTQRVADGVLPLSVWLSVYSRQVSLWLPFELEHLPLHL
jgi:hypothetical protein